MDDSFFKGKKIGVLGRARSGIAAANLAVSLGSDVLLSEKAEKDGGKPPLKIDRRVRQEFGGHSGRLLRCAVIVKSPGVPGDIPILQKARKKKIRIMGELELALQAGAPGRIIAVTGTNGKTTATTLLGGLCSDAFPRKAVTGGNIGMPLAEAAPRVTPSTTAVLEVSSYQLEDFPDFHPNVGCILNITPDHLEHHHSMRSYIKAKMNVFVNQDEGDFCVLNYDDPACRALAEKCPSKVIFFSRRKVLREGVSWMNGRILIRLPGIDEEMNGTLKMPGMHNVENALACVAAAFVSGIPVGLIERHITSFPGVEHRIEFVRRRDGADYYNDSKATNVDSTRVALESFDRPVWLILGGRDKGAPYKPLDKLIREKVKGILLIGEAAEIIRCRLKGAAPMIDCGDMRRAVRAAAERAGKGDVVLLSPACASFDQFRDYEERGCVFKQLVRGLK